MIELSATTAGAWLEARGVRARGMTFCELGGGVSNRVVLAESDDWRAVLKQSMGRLRVEEEWLSDPRRIFVKLPPCGCFTHGCAAAMFLNC